MAASSGIPLEESIEFKDIPLSTDKRLGLASSSGAQKGGPSAQLAGNSSQTGASAAHTGGTSAQTGGELSAPLEIVKETSFEVKAEKKDGCCSWLCGSGAERREVRATTRLFVGTQKARAWEAAQEEKIVNSKWYNRCLDCLTCYSPEIETAQQARRPDPQNWTLGLCDCIKYRNVQGRGNWMLLWSLLWPNWTFGMIWTVYVEEEQVCDNVCWDLCVTMGWRGICCCCLLFPLQWGTQCHVFLPCFLGTSYGMRKATVEKYNIREKPHQTLLYGCLCPFCSMSQAYIHITEIQEREDLLLLLRESDAAAAALNPQTLTVAPESLEMERPQGPRSGDVEMREAAAEGGLAGAESPGGVPAEVRTKAPFSQRMGDQLKKDAKWVRKRATHEFGRVFAKHEHAQIDGSQEHDEFLDARNTLRYKHAPWSGVKCC